MTTKRLYLRKDIEAEDVDVWLASKIPPVPDGQLCESEGCNVEYANPMAGDHVLATTYSYRIEDGHVCYSYICDDCGERCDPDYLSENPYPATSGGYAVAPKHCT